MYVHTKTYLSDPAPTPTPTSLSILWIGVAADRHRVGFIQIGHGCDWQAASMGGRLAAGLLNDARRTAHPHMGTGYHPLHLPTLRVRLRVCVCVCRGRWAGV